MSLTEELKSFLQSAKNPLVVILGATATGKTDISLKIAKDLNGEIISTDSRQIYQEMPIATDTIEDQKGIPHHMLAIRKPDEPFTLAQYKEMALEIIDGIYERGHVPILAGGTGLYVSAITEGYDVPRAAPNEKLRKKLNEEAEKHGAEYIYEKLKKLDSQAAKNIHPNNIRYVIRAIEINKSTKAPKKDKKSQPKFDIFMLGIQRPREEIYERINKRVDQQKNTGLLDEVKALVEKGYDPALPSMTSLGVKEIIPYIKGEMPLPECLEILKRNTRRYAKRQMTWLKRYDNVRWLTPKSCQSLERSG
ncbi:MAG: tRNA (adenosine(37)-N6)-dimethylallyltransferase MiaA [Nitrospirota bacterium]